MSDRVVRVEAVNEYRLKMRGLKEGEPVGHAPNVKLQCKWVRRAYDGSFVQYFWKDVPFADYLTPDEEKPVCPEGVKPEKFVDAVAQLPQGRSFKEETAALKPGKKYECDVYCRTCGFIIDTYRTKDPVSVNQMAGALVRGEARKVHRAKTGCPCDETKLGPWRPVKKA